MKISIENMCRDARRARDGSGGKFPELEVGINGRWLARGAPAPARGRTRLWYRLPLGAPWVLLLGVGGKPRHRLALLAAL